MSKAEDNEEAKAMENAVSISNSCDDTADQRREKLFTISHAGSGGLLACRFLEAELPAFCTIFI